MTGIFPLGGQAPPRLIKSTGNDALRSLPVVPPPNLPFHEGDVDWACRDGGLYCAAGGGGGMPRFGAEDIPPPWPGFLTKEIRPCCHGAPFLGDSFNRCEFLPRKISRAAYAGFKSSRAARL